MTKQPPSAMSSENQNNAAASDMRHRRGSVTSVAFTNLFQRSNSTSAGTSFPGPIATAAMNNPHRRLSVSTIGLSGTSPTSSFGLRRSSMSTNNSDSIDENAVEDDDVGSGAGARTAPTTPFARRMSFGAQAMRGLRTGSGGSSPGTNDQGFNWSEQLRSRAENSVASGSRPSVSFASGLAGSPPRPAPASGPHHDRAKSVSDMPVPPAQPPKPRQDPRPKPDHFQERILKGDFYMD